MREVMFPFFFSFLFILVKNVSNFSSMYMKIQNPSFERKVTWQTTESDITFSAYNFGQKNIKVADCKAELFLT